jgi:hypothetical protein
MMLTKMPPKILIIVATTQRQALVSAIAAQTLTPTVLDLQALILMPQAQVAALQADTPASPAAGAAAVITFADMPQTLSANKLLDYLNKRGSSIYDQRCKALNNKALTNGFMLTLGYQPDGVFC